MTHDTIAPANSMPVNSAPCQTINHVREWKIYSFLVSALAVALAIEVIWLRTTH